jgi:hypothetical protein
MDRFVYVFLNSDGLGNDSIGIFLNVITLLLTSEKALKWIEDYDWQSESLFEHELKIGYRLQILLPPRPPTTRQVQSIFYIDVFILQM